MSSNERLRRFAVAAFDASTFAVVDNITKSEFCVCSDFNDAPSARVRAITIAKLLNDDWSNAREYLKRSLNLG